MTSGSRGWSEYYADQGAIFIRAANLNKDRLDLADAAYVDLPANAEGIRTKVTEGDFLITITGANVTKSGVVDRPLEDAYVSQHVGLVRLVWPDTAPYLYTWCRAYGGGKGYLEDAAYGAGKPGLNLSNIYEMTVALPPRNERLEIDRMITGAPEALDTAPNLPIPNLRQSILSAAFKGDLIE